MSEIANVLLVDDEPDIRTIGAMSLRRVGKWEVRVASSGAEAISLAVEAVPDVILLDVMMPELDGPATLKALRENPKLASVPVIFMTAKVQAKEVERWLAIGAVGVIRKPFDPMTLPSEIKSLVAAR
ncbi:MAG: response regulator [Polyangiales bacterium]